MPLLVVSLFLLVNIQCCYFYGLGAAFLVIALFRWRGLCFCERSASDRLWAAILGVLVLGGLADAEVPE